MFADQKSWRSARFCAESTTKKRPQKNANVPKVIVPLAITRAVVVLFVGQLMLPKHPHGEHVLDSISKRRREYGPLG